jgi:ribosome-associated protein
MEPLEVGTEVGTQLVIPVRDLEWRAVRSSGPGGQNVNKVSSKVELRFDLPGCEVIWPAAKARLMQLARNRLDAEGRVLITSQKTRDQLQNLSDAREKLAALIASALVAPVFRKPTKPTRGSKLRRLEGKKHQASKKQARGRVGEHD